MIEPIPQAPLDSLAQTADTVVCASDIFGSASTLAVQATAPDSPLSLTDQPLFQGIILMLLLAYMILVHNDIARIHSFFNTHSRNNLLFENSNSNPIRSFASTFIMGVLFASALTIRFAADTPSIQPFGAVYNTGCVLLLFASLLALVGLFQYGALAFIGWLTLSQEVTEEMIQLKTTLFTFGVIIGAPVLLLFVLTPTGSGLIWSYTLGIEAIFILFIFLKRSLMLFLTKKISILHWFLYLCAIELFPISILWFLAQGK
ncbi:MAG: DUF4271 domain-containing protein [Alistipes sp.]